MSTLAVGVLKSNATTPPVVQNTSGVEVGQFIRAWVNFNGTTNIIRSSFNVSTITDNGISDYTLNFTNAMPDANFCGVVTASGVTSTYHCVPFLGAVGTNDTSSMVSATAFRFSQYNVTNSNQRAEAVTINVIVVR